MRKFYKYIILILFIILTVLYLFKVNIEKNLIEKKTSIDNTWNEIIKNNDSKIYYIKKNLQHFRKDSLSNIINFNKSKEKSNDDYTFFMFQLNDYLINSKIDVKSKAYFARIDTINNHLIKRYNNEVILFNRYASSFPIIIIARKKNYKTYDKFPIVFGKENKNPKISKEKALDWLKDIEKKEGL